MTDSARQALEHLRDSSQFSWYVIPLLLVVFYVYAVEVERKNWNVFLGGLAFWGMDWFNELWNSAFFHATDRAPVWGTVGSSAYQILIGLNIEITFMFAIMGIYAVKILPADPKLKILGINNRWFISSVNAALCVVVELWLNHIGVLTWDWSWWNASMPVLIFLFGYLTFFVAAFVVHDLPRMRTKLGVVGTIYAVDVLGAVVLGLVGWL